MKRWERETKDADFSKVCSRVCVCVCVCVCGEPKNNLHDFGFVMKCSETFKSVFLRFKTSLHSNKSFLRVVFFFLLQNQNPLYQSPEMKYENIAYGRE